MLGLGDPPPGSSQGGGAPLLPHPTPGQQGLRSRLRPLIAVSPRVAPWRGRAHRSWFWKNSAFSRHSYTQPGANRAAENPCFRINSSDWGDSRQGCWVRLEAKEGLELPSPSQPYSAFLVCPL